MDIVDYTDIDYVETSPSLLEVATDATVNIDNRLNANAVRNNASGAKTLFGSHFYPYMTSK